MSIGYTNTQNYTDIADAIREKNGTNTEYAPSEMAQAIKDIEIPEQTLGGFTMSDNKSEELKPSYVSITDEIQEVD